MLEAAVASVLEAAVAEVCHSACFRFRTFQELVQVGANTGRGREQKMQPEIVLERLWIWRPVLE